MSEFEYTDYRNMEDVSSNLLAAWYDRRNGVLAIQFQSSPELVYGYEAVPVGDWESLVDEANNARTGGGSPGGYYIRAIKGKYHGFMFEADDDFVQVEVTPEAKIAAIQAESNNYTFNVTGKRPIVTTTSFFETVRASNFNEAIEKVRATVEGAEITSVALVQ